MPSFHIRSSDGSLAPCRDGNGRVLDSCGLHGSSDIVAPDVESAYAIMDSRERSLVPGVGMGMGGHAPGAWECLHSCMPSSGGGAVPRPLHGSAAMVAGLLSRRRRRV